MISEWSGTSLKVKNTNDNDFINLLRQEQIRCRGDEHEDEVLLLDNQTHDFIYENEFIDQSNNLNLIIKKFLKKEYCNLNRVYDKEKNEFVDVKSDSSDLDVYARVVKNNLIDGDQREFNISINTLNNIFNESKKPRLFLDILIMFAIANKVKYDAENVEVEFCTEDSVFKENYSLNISTPLYLYDIYDWIFNSQEYKDSYEIKLKIIRHVICKKGNLNDISGILRDSKAAFKRIASRKTDDYFNQLNQLKEDFLTLSKSKNGALRTLHIAFFTWLGSLGYKLMDIVLRYDNNQMDIYDYIFWSKGDKQFLLTVGFLIGLIAIYAVYCSEIKSLEKTYDVIRAIYKDKLFFETDSEGMGSFDDILCRPKVGCQQTIVFVVIGCCLIIRMIVALKI